jgi:hypothetical protein
MGRVGISASCCADLTANLVQYRTEEKDMTAAKGNINFFAICDPDGDVIDGDDEHSEVWGTREAAIERMEAIQGDWDVALHVEPVVVEEQ